MCSQFLPLTVNGFPFEATDNSDSNGSIKTGMELSDTIHFKGSEVISTGETLQPLSKLLTAHFSSPFKSYFSKKKSHQCFWCNFSVVSLQVSSQAFPELHPKSLKHCCCFAVTSWEEAEWLEGSVNGSVGLRCTGGLGLTQYIAYSTLAFPRLHHVILLAPRGWSLLPLQC